MKKFLSILMILFLTGCGGASFKNISVDETKKMMDQGGVTVLDVRTPDEYNSGHIQGSELIPLQVLDGMSEELKKDKKYIIVCRSGNRSQQAAQILSEKGFKNIFNMTGGMNQWSYEIEK